MNFTRTKDFPAAKVMHNANVEFDHEPQVFKHSEPELDVVIEPHFGFPVQWSGFLK